MNRIATYIAILALTAAVAFASGFITKGRFVQAELAKASQQALTQSKTNVVTSIEKSQELEGQIKKADDSIAAIEVAVTKRLKTKGKSHVKQPSTAPQAPEQDAANCPDYSVLDVGTVQLLNAVRTGASLEPRFSLPD